MKKIFIALCLFGFAFCAIAESRNALLIANDKYTAFGSLATPVKEARDLKKTLETLGFSVTVIENASKEKMQDAIDDFGNKLTNQGGIGFFHYGGHAVQVDGVNYLIPVDADIPDERRVRTRAISSDEIMVSMSADTNIVILDACRNNPLPASSGRSATRGLVLSTVRPKNSIIIYSAQPGSVAQDGVFTPILTQKLLEKKELGSILRDVRREVSQRTNGAQSPGEYNELIADVYLAGFVNQTTTEKKKTVAKESKKAKSDLVAVKKNENTITILDYQGYALGVKMPYWAISFSQNITSDNSRALYDEISKSFPNKVLLCASGEGSSLDELKSRADSFDLITSIEGHINTAAHLSVFASSGSGKVEKAARKIDTSSWEKEAQFWVSVKDNTSGKAKYKYFVIYGIDKKTFESRVNTSLSGLNIKGYTDKEVQERFYQFFCPCFNSF